MSERKTIRININNYDKLMDLKELKGYKSLNEVLNITWSNIRFKHRYLSIKKGHEHQGVVTYNTLMQYEK